jgi:hypothetical protein
MTEGHSFLKNKQEKNKTKKHKNVFKKERKTKMLNIPSSNKKNFKSFIEKMKTFFLIVIITSILSGIIGAKVGYDFAKNNSESTASAITEAVKTLNDEKNIVKK